MGTNPWFRFYSEFATDPKIQFMSEALQRRYVFALCVTCNGEIEKVTDDELAFAMRISPEDWADTKRIFIERGLFTPEGRVRNWDKRQYKSDVADPTNAERQKRYRNRQRNGGVTEGKRPDTDTDTEEDSTRLEIPFHQIIAAFNKFCPSLPKVDEISIPSPRHLLIKAIYLKYAQREEGPLFFLDAAFKKAERSSFLTGKIVGGNGRCFRAKLDWILDEIHFAKILEGDYDDAPAPPPRKREVAI